MREKLKTLESLAEEAVRRIGKLEGENKKLAAELRQLHEQCAKLQVQLRDHHAIKARHEKVKGRIEKVLDMVGKLEDQAAASGAPAEAAPAPKSEAVKTPPLPEPAQAAVPSAPHKPEKAGKGHAPALQPSLPLVGEEA